MKWIISFVIIVVLIVSSVFLWNRISQTSDTAQLDSVAPVSQTEEESTTKVRTAVLIPANVTESVDGEVFLSELKTGENKIGSQTVKRIQSQPSATGDARTFVFDGTEYELRTGSSAVGMPSYSVYQGSQQDGRIISTEKGEVCAGADPMLLEFDGVLFLIDAVSGRSGFTGINVCTLQANKVAKVLDKSGTAKQDEYGIGHDILGSHQISLVEKDSQIYLKIHNDSEYATKFGKENLHYLFVFDSNN